MVALFLMIIALTPLLFYVVDGYHEKNVKKGIIQILGFLTLGCITILLLRVLLLKLVLALPFFIFCYIFIITKKN
jgi:hypothetical protein